MKAVTKFITDDGCMFDTEKDARHHLEKEYANHLCGLAHKLIAIDKYQKMVNFLHENENLLREMLEIKDELSDDCVINET